MLFDRFGCRLPFEDTLTEGRSRMQTKRFSVLALILLVISSISWANGTKDQAPSAATAAKGFDWKQFSGKTIVVCFPNHVQYNAVMPLIPDFEKLTGIKVEVDQLQYVKMHDKEVLEMSKPQGQGDYDLITIINAWKAELATSNLIQPLDTFFSDKALLPPDYDYEDLIPKYVEGAGSVGGSKIYLGGPGSKLYALPFGTETSMLIYRKDIFDKYNLKVPTTYEELAKTAQFITEKEKANGVYGITMRGQAGHQAAHAWLLHASPLGAKWFNDAWEPLFTSPESLATLKFMKDMQAYGPPGMSSFDQDGEFQSFLQGNAAMYVDASVFAPLARNPEKSKVYDKLGYAMQPKGKVISTEMGGFAIGIPANAKNPKEAFLFMAWLTSKDTAKKIMLNGGAPFRISTLKDPELQAKYPEYKVLADTIPYINPDWRPIIPQFNEIENIFGIAVNQVLTGQKTPEEAMQGIMQPERDLMVKYGYIK